MWELPKNGSIQIGGLLSGSALSAARKMREELKGQRIGIILSGGNIDMERYSNLLSNFNKI
ncbi:hypothetical protein [Xenorhabdus bovienii]|uniref:hypothetical protein n=1 Tax=Xenorhabdus bovienii TaxID=40576 RepID=UPI00237C87C6|nr:hypothetical protein [Xenorhabdus bovienii]